MVLLLCNLNLFYINILKAKQENPETTKLVDNQLDHKLVELVCFFYTGPISPLCQYLVHWVPDLQVSLFLALPEVFTDPSSFHTELLVLHIDNKGNTVTATSSENTTKQNISSAM